MNRRSFFRKAATGAAVLAIAPTVLSEPFMPSPIAETIGEYYDYTNFSSFAIASSIDQMVEQAAAELAKAHGQRIAALVNA